jgi:hypothetical protein
MLAAARNLTGSNYKYKYQQSGLSASACMRWPLCATSSYILSACHVQTPLSLLTPFLPFALVVLLAIDVCLCHLHAGDGLP